MKASMTSLPATLPRSITQLLKELDQLNPAPKVTGHLTDPEQIQSLVFAAGRRSVIDELLRLQEKEPNL